MEALLQPKTLIAVAALALLWMGESWVPFYTEFGNWPARLRHDARNLALGLLNALLVGALAAIAFSFVFSAAEASRFGLLRRFEAAVWIETAAALLLIDFWMYLWHRANHAVPLLWRFHRVHHSDPAMDATTGLRFHTGEVLASLLARLAVFPLLGVELWQVVVYEAVFLPVVLLQHSNLRLPRWLDYGLLALLVTPAMHRVHHSRWRPETDSNYSSVLPYWDYLFRSFRIRRDARRIHLGLAEFDGESWQSLWGMIRTPFATGASREALETDDEEVIESSAPRAQVDCGGRPESRE